MIQKNKLNINMHTRKTTKILERCFKTIQINTIITGTLLKTILSEFMKETEIEAKKEEWATRK